MEEYINNAFTREEGKTNLEINNLTATCIASKNNKFELDSEGNLTVKSINTIDRLTTLDEIYPVGSIYMSVNGNNPTTLFGGTWEQIKDKFLLSCGDTFENGTLGGEINHTLTVNEMPTHTHSISSSGGHNHNAYFKEHRIPTANYSGTSDYARKSSASHDTTGQVTVSNGAHTHTPANTGGNESHNNMPPYLAVYMWKRIQ